MLIFLFASGPTTTYFDIEYADFLAEIGGIDNITELYLEMGKAKSDIEGMTTREVSFSLMTLFHSF